jgi:predicted nucleic acid-binding protein
LIAVDTSLAVAAALPWHASHREALAALPPERTALLAQVAVETYSVLTRLPGPRRVAASVAHSYLTEAFAWPLLTLPASGYDELLTVAAAKGIAGGALHDALVAATAKHVGAVLLTADRRAVATYQLLGVEYRLVG